MVYLVNLKACVPTEWIFLIFASCQSFSKISYFKISSETWEEGIQCVCVVFFLNVAILKLSYFYAVMKCLAHSL